MDKCHYCDSFTSNTKKNYYEHTMYGVVKSHLIKGMGYTYREKKVIIPRCEDCSKKHTNQFERIDLPIFLVTFLSFLWFFTYKVGVSGFKWITLIPSFVAGIIAMAILSPIVHLFIGSSSKTGKKEDDIKMHPTVRQLRAKGWKLDKPAKGAYITEKDLIKED